jgi:hypothetical protein
VHALRFQRHLAYRIEITLERAPGGKMVDQFDTADFYDAVAVGRVESGGFGVENDFTNVLQLCQPSASRVVR